MRSKLIAAGVFAGMLASVPVLMERGSGLFGGGTGSAQPAGAPKLAMARAEPDASATETLSGGKVRLSTDARGHFSGEFSLNGRSMPAMIDTGATVVAINRSTARRIGLKLAASDFDATVETANGRVKAANATIERIAIGRVEARNVRAVVLEDRALTGALIGLSFLSQMRRYAVEDGVLVLEQ